MQCDPEVANHEINVLVSKLRKVKNLELKSLENTEGITEIDNNIWGLQNIRLNIWGPQNIRLNI